MSGRRAGRPSKLTAELTESICNDLRLGLFADEACTRNGITKVTYYEWLREAAAGRTDHMVFAAAVAKASADGEAAALRVIRQGTLNWQASAWFLERRFRDRWARDVDRSDGAPKPSEVVFRWAEPTAATPDVATAIESES